MVYRLVADENVDYRVVHRLEHYGHDIEHVDRVPTLGKGSNDEAIAAYSLDENRLTLTNDDFLREFDAEEYVVSCSSRARRFRARRSRMLFTRCPSVLDRTKSRTCFR